MRRKFEPKDVYVVWSGSDTTVVRKITTFFRHYGLEKPGQKRTIYERLRKYRSWSSKDGTLLIRKSPMLDFLPPKY